MSIQQHQFSHVYLTCFKLDNLPLVLLLHSTAGQLETSGLSWFRLICWQWWGQSRERDSKFFFSSSFCFISDQSERRGGSRKRRRKWCNRFPAGASLYFSLLNSGEGRVRNSAFNYFIPAKHTTVIQSKARNIPGRLSASEPSVISIHGTAVDANLVFREFAVRSSTRCQFFQCSQASQNSHRWCSIKHCLDSWSSEGRIWEI